MFDKVLLCATQIHRVSCVTRRCRTTWHEKVGTSGVILAIIIARSRDIPVTSHNALIAEATFQFYTTSSNMLYTSSASLCLIFTVVLGLTTLLPCFAAISPWPTERWHVSCSCSRTRESKASWSTLVYSEVGSLWWLQYKNLAAEVLL